MKKLSVFVAILVIGAGVAIAANEKFAPQKIDIEGLKALRESGEVFALIDSRGGKYFDGEVIEGAKHLPVDEQTEEKLSEIVPDKSTKVVFYCSNVKCPASELGGFKAKASGYDNVYKYPGGFEEWKKMGLPTTKL